MVRSSYSTDYRDTMVGEVGRGGRGGRCKGQQACMCRSGSLIHRSFSLKGATADWWETVTRAVPRNLAQRPRLARNKSGYEYLLIVPPLLRDFLPKYSGRARTWETGAILDGENQESPGTAGLLRALLLCFFDFLGPAVVRDFPRFPGGACDLAASGPLCPEKTGDCASTVTTKKYLSK